MNDELIVICLLVAAIAMATIGTVSVALDRRRGALLALSIAAGLGVAAWFVGALGVAGGS